MVAFPVSGRKGSPNGPHQESPPLIARPKGRSRPASRAMDGRERPSGRAMRGNERSFCHAGDYRLIVICARTTPHCAFAVGDYIPAEQRALEARDWFLMQPMTLRKA